MIQTRATAAMAAAQKLKRTAMPPRVYSLVDTFLIESGKLFNDSDSEHSEFLELFEQFTREASYSGRMVKDSPLRAQEYTKIARPILKQCEDVLARWYYNPKLKLYIEIAGRQAMLALSADFLRTAEALPPERRALYEDLEDCALELLKAREIDEGLLRDFINLNYTIHDQVQAPTLHTSLRDEHLDSIQKLEVEAMMVGLY